MAALEVFVQLNFGRLRALDGSTGKIGRFFPSLRRGGSRSATGVAEATTRGSFCIRCFAWLLLPTLSERPNSWRILRLRGLRVPDLRKSRRQLSAVPRALGIHDMHNF